MEFEEACSVVQTGKKSPLLGKVQWPLDLLSLLREEIQELPRATAAQ